MSREGLMEDSLDNWKYTSVLSKFVINCIEVAISKSFGVLLPVMIIVLSTNTRTLGFVCSLPSALMNLACPLVGYVLQMNMATPRTVAVIGSFLSSVCLIATGYITSVPVLAICLSLTGIGLSMGYLSSKIMLNEYFKRSYVLMAAIANFGNTAGALIAPFIVERALEAYGYAGAILVLGGISLHGLPASATMRQPRETQMRRITQEREIRALLPDGERSSKNDPRKKRQQAKSNLRITEDSQSNRLAVPLENHDSTTIQTFQEWAKNCILIKEPLMTISFSSIFLTAFGISSWVLFLVPRAEWHGIPSSKAALLSTIAGAGGIIGRLFYIALIYLDANAIFLSCIFTIISAITFLTDPLITTFPEMCVIAFIQGWCIFSCQIATSAYMKYAVSDENFRIAVGFQGLLAGVGALLGGFISGLIKDASQSFTAVFFVLGAVFTVNVMTTLLFYIAYRRKTTVS